MFLSAWLLSESLRTSLLSAATTPGGAALHARARAEDQPVRGNHLVLRGGPLLAGDDERARLVELLVPEIEITMTAANGGTARFRITGEYELVDGSERRVYRFVDPLRAEDG